MMSDQRTGERSGWAIFLIFLRLGMTSFGGPVAHLGYYRAEFVARRGWMSEHSYADLVALCQFLPGPASSQLGMAIGLSRGGYVGALAAWLGFTLPSAVLMVLFALGVAHYGTVIPTGALHGLKVVAVAVVAQAVWGMARTLCVGAGRMTLMMTACAAALLLPYSGTQVAIIGVAALIGWRCFTSGAVTTQERLPVDIGQRSALVWLALFFLGLLVLPLLAKFVALPVVDRIDAFYRAGALVFGGGHVVLPLLQAAVVPAGWVSNETFLAGYGLAQAVPGPLFTFSAFLGASMNGTPTGGWGGIVCLIAIFLPGFLLILGTIPFWERLRRVPGMQAALAGVNAAVVGLLLAALYTPVWTSAIFQPVDFALAMIALIALAFWKVPPWLAVVASALAGWLLTLPTA